MKKYKVVLYLVNQIVIVDHKLKMKTSYRSNQFHVQEIQELQQYKMLIVNIKQCSSLFTTLNIFKN